MGKHYLRHIHMQAFGRFSDVTVGPFEPGLNVVYGKNEAGKTTVSSFVCGVLFGWEDARGSKNVYKPAAAERSGSLIFCRKKTGATVELSRVRNADGLIARPESAASLVDDIDKKTYGTVFALTSDELRGLGDAGDMTSRLLTAGSGTVVSPAQALAAIDARIATYTSRAASAPHSFPNLKKELDDCRARIAEAREESETLKDEDCELRELKAKRESDSRALAEANARVEALAALKADLDRLVRQESEALSARDSAQREVDAAEAAAREAVGAGAMRMSASDEASLRERVEREREAQDRIDHRVEAAQDDFSDARARYEASKAASGSPSSKRAVLPTIALIALAVLGGAWGIAGFQAGSASMAVPALVCMAAAIVLAAVSVVSLRGRGTRQDDTELTRRAMLEKKGVLESREAEALEAKMRAETLLSSVGLADAGGSLRRAIEILDSVRTARQARDRASERLRQATERRDSFALAAEECATRRAECLEACGLDPESSSADVESHAIAAAQRRDSLTERIGIQNRRIGELGQILAAAERGDELDILKTERAQIVTRQQESGIELARLLLARRMVADAIRAWESESQPEVYARASELMSLMTEGVWTGVLMDESSLIRALDAVGRAWEPRFLSLGTCQQLYLALRIALLECVDHVGSNLPVLADDILVNFDDDRRRGAARALASLAEKRQVIVFTCHREVVDLMVEHAKDCKVLGL